MEENVDLKVTVEVSEAEQGLEKVVQKAQEAKEKVEDLNDKTQEGIPAIKGLGQSFETALGKADGSMKGLISSITGTIKGIKGFAPAFKAARVAGDSLWKSIKVGIASTGIGLLIVAIGEVIGNWEKWTSTIQSWLPWAKKGTEETDSLVQANEDLLEANKEQNDEINFQVRLMKALGAEEKDVINYKIKETQALKSNTEAQIKETEAKIASMKAHSAFRRWITGENKDIEKLEESLKSLKEENERLEKSIKGFNQDLIIEEAKSQTERTKAAKKGADDRKKIAEDSAKKIEELARQEAEAYVQAYEKSIEGLRKILDQVNDLRLQEKAKGKVLGEILNDDAYSPENIDKAASALRVYEQKLLDLQEATRANRDLFSQMYTGYLEAMQIGDFENAAKFANAAGKALEQLRVVIPEATKAVQDEFRGAVNTIKADNRILWEDYFEDLEQLKYEYESKMLEFESLDSTEQINKQYELDEQRLKEHIDYLNRRLEAEEIYSDEYLAILLEIEKAENELSIRRRKKDKDEEEALKSKVLTYTQAAQSIGEIFGTIADAQEDSIRRRLENNEIGEEQAEKEFERVKGYQLAQTWINTLAGMTAAIASVAGGGPAGWIAGAAQAAAILASGIAQTAKIRATKFNEGGTSGGGNIPNVGVTPIDVRDDIQVSPTTLAQSQSPADQRVWILQSDLEDSHKQVEIRESNSTF